MLANLSLRDGLLLTCRSAALDFIRPCLGETLPSSRTCTIQWGEGFGVGARKSPLWSSLMCRMCFHRTRALSGAGPTGSDC